MDEFDKIKELSDDIIKQKEPSFDLEHPEQSEPLPILSDEKSEDILPESFDKNPLSSFKGHLIALSAFICILVIALTVVFVSGDDKQPDKVITITATPNPVKIKPEQQDNAPSFHPEQVVYNRSREIPQKIEKLFPEPEKPVLPEIMSKTSDSTENIQEKSTEVSFVIEEIVPQKKNTDAPKPEIKTEQKITKNQSVEKSDKNIKNIAKSPDKGTEYWRVQLLSTSKKSTAEKAWVDISKKQKALLSDMSHEIVSADIAGKGTFYRLQVGRFKTREQAAALCSKLKAQKQYCVPVKGVPNK